MSTCPYTEVLSEVRKEGGAGKQEAGGQERAHAGLAVSTCTGRYYSTERQQTRKNSFRSEEKEPISHTLTAPTGFVGMG